MSKDLSESTTCNPFVIMFREIEKTVLESIKAPFLDRDRSIKQFEQNLVFLKVMMMFVLVVMAVYFIYNFGPVSYNNNTSKTSFIGPLVGESILFGICIALSFLILVLLRTGSFSKFSKINQCFLSIFIFIFIFFLILNLLFEWSGFSDVSLNPLPTSVTSLISYFFSPETVNSPTTGPALQNTNTVYNFIDSFSFASKFILIFIISIPVISVFFLTPFCNFFKNCLTVLPSFKKMEVYSIIPKYDSLKEKSGFTFGSMTILLFIFECFLFGLCGLIPTLLMIKNRDSNADLTSDYSIQTLAEMMAIMIYFNIVFQVSGFYANIFEKTSF